MDAGVTGILIAHLGAFGSGELKIFLKQHMLFVIKQTFSMRGSFKQTKKLEDLKVLERSPDLLNNVKIGQGQLRHFI